MLNITYDEVKSKLLLIVNGDYRNDVGPRMNVYTDYSFGYSRGCERDNREDYIAVAWMVDGEQGGNCWGDSPSRVSSERPIDLEPLLTMFPEDEIPEVSFLQYTKLKRECFEEYTRSETEYYGNWSRHEGIALNMRKLYDTLVEMGHIVND